MARMTTSSPQRVPWTGSAGDRPALRLGAAARRRNVASAVAGLLLIVVGGLTFATVSIRMSGAPVLALARDVPAGHLLEASDLQVVHVSSDGGVIPVPATDEDSLVGHPAAVSLVAGTLLSRSEVGTPLAMDRGEVIVPMALKPGQFAPALAAGDHVAVLDASSATGSAGDQMGGSLTEAMTTGTVASVEDQAAAAGSGSIVSLRVAAGDAGRIAAIPAEHVKLVLLPPDGGGR
jgi:SAF domain